MAKPHAEIPVFGPAKKKDPGGPTPQLEILIDSLSGDTMFRVGAVYTEVEGYPIHNNPHRPEIKVAHRHILVFPTEPHYSVNASRRVYLRVATLTDLVRGPLNQDLEFTNSAFENWDGLRNPQRAFRERLAVLDRDGRGYYFKEFDEVAEIDPGGATGKFLKKLVNLENISEIRDELPVEIYNLNQVTVLPSEEYLRFLMDLAQGRTDNWGNVSRRIPFVAPFPLRRLRESRTHPVGIVAA